MTFAQRTTLRLLATAYALLRAYLSLTVVIAGFFAILALALWAISGQAGGLAAVTAGTAALHWLARRALDRAWPHVAGAIVHA